MNLTKLKNGLRIITKKILGTEAVTVLVMCGAGSRYENREISGLSHFLEHMFFKGAKRYQDSKAVAEAIDSVGGDFNAFTGKEYVGYYVTVPKEKYLVAIDVLSDMMLNSKFDEEEIERERGVILEEMNMYEDLPMHKVQDVFEEHMFGDNPLGWDVIGTRETVSNMKRENFVDYLNKQYTSDNIVISVAGAIDEAKIRSDIEKYFTYKDSKHQISAYSFPGFLDNWEKVRLVTKGTEQAHLVLGLPAPGGEVLKTKLIYRLIATILGGNMSSRMFISVRERQGLCYYVRSHFSGFNGAGYLETSAGVDLKRVDQAISSIIREYDLFLEDGLEESELVKAKEYLKGKTTLGLEDSSSLAQFYAQQEIIYGKIYDLEELKTEIDKISMDEIISAAKSLLKKDQLRLTLIGPYDDSSRFEKLLS